MSDGTVSICERCREIVDEQAPGIVYASTVLSVGTFEEPDETIEGLGVFFHEACWRPSPRYRRTN